MAGETSSEHKQEVRWESRVQAKVLLRGDGKSERRGEGKGARRLRALQNMRIWVLRQKPLKNFRQVGIIN